MDIIRSIRNKLERVGKTKVKALYEDDFIQALKDLGVYEDILGGKKHCVFCDRVIDLENLQAIIPKDSGIKFVCSDINCWSKYNRND